MAAQPIEIPADVKRVIEELEEEAAEGEEDMDQGLLEDIWLKAGEMDLHEMTSDWELEKRRKAEVRAVRKRVRPVDPDFDEEEELRPARKRRKHHQHMETEHFHKCKRHREREEQQRLLRLNATLAETVSSFGASPRASPPPADHPAAAVPAVPAVANVGAVVGAGFTLTSEAAGRLKHVVKQELKGFTLMKASEASAQASTTSAQVKRERDNELLQRLTARVYNKPAQSFAFSATSQNGPSKNYLGEFMKFMNKSKAVTLTSIPAPLPRRPPPPTASSALPPPGVTLSAVYKPGIMSSARPSAAAGVGKSAQGNVDRSTITPVPLAARNLTTKLAPFIRRELAASPGHHDPAYFAAIVAGAARRRQAAGSGGMPTLKPQARPLPTPTPTEGVRAAAAAARPRLTALAVEIAPAARETPPPTLTSFDGRVKVESAAAQLAEMHRKASIPPPPLPLQPRARPRAWPTPTKTEYTTGATLSAIIDGVATFSSDAAATEEGEIVDGRRREADCLPAGPPPAPRPPFKKVPRKTTSRSRKRIEDAANRARLAVRREANAVVIKQETNGVAMKQQAEGTAIKQETDGAEIKPETNGTAINGAATKQERNDAEIKQENNGAAIKQETNRAAMKQETDRVSTQPDATDVKVDGVPGGAVLKVVLAANVPKTARVRTIPSNVAVVAAASERTDAASPTAPAASAPPAKPAPVRVRKPRARKPCARPRVRRAKPPSTPSPTKTIDGLTIDLRTGAILPPAVDELQDAFDSVVRDFALDRDDESLTLYGAGDAFDHVTTSEIARSLEPITVVLGGAAANGAPSPHRTPPRTLPVAATVLPTGLTISNGRTITAPPRADGEMTERERANLCGLDKVLAKLNAELALATAAERSAPPPSGRADGDGYFACGPDVESFAGLACAANSNGAVNSASVSSLTITPNVANSMDANSSAGVSDAAASGSPLSSSVANLTDAPNSAYVGSVVSLTNGGNGNDAACPNGGGVAKVATMFPLLKVSAGMGAAERLASNVRRQTAPQFPGPLPALLQGVHPGINVEKNYNGFWSKTDPYCCVCSFSTKHKILDKQALIVAWAASISALKPDTSNVLISADCFPSTSQYQGDGGAGTAMAAVLLTCVRCNATVHAACYGVTMLPAVRAMWKCDKCRAAKFTAACCLCNLRGGALKRTTSGGWVHLVCALLLPGVTFKNRVCKEPVNTTTLSAGHRDLECFYCRRTAGACVKCHEPSCAARFHVTCCLAAGGDLVPSAAPATVLSRAFTLRCHTHSNATTTATPRPE